MFRRIDVCAHIIYRQFFFFQPLQKLLRPNWVLRLRGNPCIFFALGENDRHAMVDMLYELISYFCYNGASKERLSVTLTFITEASKRKQLSFCRFDSFRLFRLIVFLPFIKAIRDN